MPQLLTTEHKQIAATLTAGILSGFQTKLEAKIIDQEAYDAAASNAVDLYNKVLAVLVRRPFNPANHQ